MMAQADYNREWMVGEDSRTPGERLAVVESKVTGIVEGQKDIEKKVDELLAAMNRGKGAFTASLLLASAVGALIMKAIDWLPLHRGGN